MCSGARAGSNPHHVEEEFRIESKGELIFAAAPCATMVARRFRVVRVASAATQWLTKAHLPSMDATAEVTSCLAGGRGELPREAHYAVRTVWDGQRGIEQRRVGRWLSEGVDCVCA